MATTFNQVREQLEAIATNHKQINTFGFGDIWEINTSGTIDYPLMWVQPENSVIANKVETLNFKFIFMDLVGNGEINENDVLSDQLEIVKDVVAQLQHPSYVWSFTVDNVVIEPFTERFTDSVSGWVMDVSLDIPFAFDRCSMPYTGNTSANSACPVVTIYDTNGTVLATVNAGGAYTCTGGTCDDATVENSDTSYTNTVVSGGALVLDDVVIEVNNSEANVLSVIRPAAVDQTITLPDTDYNIYVDGILQNSFSLPTLKDETINILWQ